MTQTTDQERAEFEAWAIDTNQGYDLTRNQSGRMQTYESVKTEHAWRGFFHGRQAARRAQVVPEQSKPFARINAESAAMIDWLWKDPAFIRKHHGQGLCLHAATPQPPDADHIPDIGKMVATPVKMPEPDINTANRVGLRVIGYTPEAVRQLLASTTLSKKSTEVPCLYGALLIVF